MTSLPDTAPSEKPETVLDETVVSVWEKTVDTQMHFNEMSVKSRQLGLTFVAAALGLGIFIFSRTGPDAKYTYEMHILGRKIIIQVAEFIFLAAAFAVYAVKQLDLGVYHQMLRGAVAFGEDLEENHIRKSLSLQKGMTQAISHFSRHADAKVSKEADGKYVYIGSSLKHAGNKISRFYTIVISSLVACTVIMFTIGNFLSQWILIDEKSSSGHNGLR